MQRIRGSTRMRYTNLLLLTYLLTYTTDDAHLSLRKTELELPGLVTEPSQLAYSTGLCDLDSCHFYLK